MLTTHEPQPADVAALVNPTRKLIIRPEDLEEKAHILFLFLSNSSLSLVRLGVDFVLPLSQEEQQQQQKQEPSPKISAVTDRILMKL